MGTQLDAAKLMVNRAAWLKDQKKSFSTEAAMAKLFATDTAMQVTTDAVQILGGSGYTQDFPVERFMREAKVLQIVEGTNQIQRVIIGRALTQGEV
jgi:alkylation response protein AidB-like acyl-CoA dehydrogenase